MNSKDFIQVMRNVIRDEVRNAVREELAVIGEMITESRNTNVKKTTVKESIIASKPVYKSTNKPAAKKQFTTNPTLNDLLNDTNGFKGEGPAAYLEENINYNDFEEWPTMSSRAPKAAGISVLPTTDAEGRRVDTSKLAQTEAGQAVVQALTKDYSLLMKAIDKKKGK